MITYTYFGNHWRRISIFILCFFTGILCNTAVAKEGKLTIDSPGMFSEAETQLDRIDNHVEKSLCGGWDVGQTVGSTVGTGIAEVTGLPGRKIEGNNPLNTIELGMPVKEDDFFFPGSEGDTCGFVSACAPDTISTGARFTPPFLQDHACQRPLDGIRSDDFPGSSAPNGDQVTYSCGGGTMADVTSDDQFCQVLSDNNPTFAGGGGQIRTPGSVLVHTANTAGGICQRLNEDWIYSLWRKKVYALDADGNCIHTGWDYKKRGCRTFDDPDINTPPAAPTVITACPSGWEFDSHRYCCTDHPLGSEFKNCVGCSGDECFNEPVNTSIANDDWRILDPAIPQTYDVNYDSSITRTNKYTSFFRHYLASYERNKLPTGDNEDIPGNNQIEATKLPSATSPKFDDNKRTNVPVPCYGFWWENQETTNDPETTFIKNSLFRCVISTYYPRGTPLGDKHFWSNSASDEEQMQFTQAGRGSYFGLHWDTGDTYEDMANDVKDDPRTDDDTWIRQLARGFSLLADTALDEEKEYDITEAIMVTDTALQRATVQRYVPSKTDLASNIGTTNENAPEVLEAFRDITMSKGGIVRSFDDTVSKNNLQRTLVNWWQQIESTMNAYFTPPSVQLILPPGWSIDLDPLHPLLTPNLPNTNDANWRRNPQNQPIDVQLELHEDLLGDVANYLEDSLLLQYTPEKIPVVVPTGSAKEFRSLAQRWCSIAIEDGDADDCASLDAGSDIGKLITKLHEYADRIDQGRILRAQSMELHGKFLALHTTIQQKLGQWVIQNAQDFINFQTEWEQRKDILPLWQEVQKKLWKFNDETNQPWCMNQRFTAPVYSFIRNWMPTSTSGTKDLSGAALPTLPDITPQAGIVFDASRIFIGTGSFKIPVLEPLPIKIDTVGIGSKKADGSVPTLPDLPPIPNFTADNAAFIPTLLSGSIVPTTFGASITLDTYYDIEDTLEEIKPIFEGMNTTYKEFWNLAKVDPEDIDDGTEEDCIQLNTGKCKHFEFDLHERFMRIGSRPNVYLKEDFEHIGEFRDTINNDPYTCLDRSFEEYKDWVCQTISPVHILPTESWRIAPEKTDEQQEAIEALRLRSLQETLENNASSTGLPFTVPVEEILPSFYIPREPVLTETGSTM